MKDYLFILIYSLHFICLTTKKYFNYYTGEARLPWRSLRNILPFERIPKIAPLDPCADTCLSVLKWINKWTTNKQPLIEQPIDLIWQITVVLCGNSFTAEYKVVSY